MNSEEEICTFYFGWEDVAILVKFLISGVPYNKRQGRELGTVLKFFYDENRCL